MDDATAVGVRGVLAAERRLKILERVADQQAVNVAKLATEFQVSEMSIRRDIHRLERDGFLKRTYGGATVHLTRSYDLAFNARALQRARQKRLIAMEASRLVVDMSAMYVGIGTTTEQFARFLPASLEATVITGSLPIASLLGTRPVRVIALGGHVRRDELSFIGPLAMETLDRFHVDLAVIGAAGVSARHGISELADEEAAINRRAIERAASVMVLADSSKLGHVSLANVSPAIRITTLVTDTDAAHDEVEALRGLGVRVVIAKAEKAEEKASPDGR